MYDDYKKINRKIFTLIVIQLLVMIIIMPGLEYPDAGIHIQKVNHNWLGELYFSIISVIRPLVDKIADTNFSLALNPDYKYFIWQPYWIHNGYNYISVMLYQLVNVILVVLSIGLFTVLVKSDKKLSDNEKGMFVRLNLLYFLYPATSYLVVGISPDVIVYLIQPFLIWLLYKRKYAIAVLLGLILFKAADKSAIISVIFCIAFTIVFGLTKLFTKNKKIFVFFLVGFVGLAGCLLIRVNILNIESSNQIINIMQLTLRNHGNLITKFGVLFLTSFCFWGSASYITFPFLYVLYGYGVVKIVIKTLKDRINNHLYFSMLITGIGLAFGLVLLFPSYCHIRYYMFLPIIFLWGFFRNILGDTYLSDNKKVWLGSQLMFLHNVVLAGLIGIYTFVIL